MTGRRNIVAGIIAFIVAIAILSPLLYCFSASFMTEKEIYASNILPSSLSLANYQKALGQAPLFRFILNSFIVSISCVFLQLFTGSLAGFAFGCLSFTGKDALFKIFLATMMIPGNAIIISNYLTMIDFKLIDSYWAMILPYMTSAFCVFNMRQAYKSLPVELQEAALIDGATDFQYLMNVGAPLTLPSLGAVGSQTFLSVWNQYLWPMLVTSKTHLRTVQIGIGMLNNSDAMAYGVIMAGTVVVMIPLVIVFMVGQKTLITGLTAGAVKG